MFSLVLRPGTPVPPPNQPPQPAFSVSCTDLTCSFDASSASVDQDGEIVSYAWEFGDETTDCCDLATQHTYAMAGGYVVTLTVTDDDAESVSLARQAEPGELASLAMVGAASTNGSRRSHVVTVPPDVTTGDQMLLLLTANGATSVTSPPGGTVLRTADNSMLTGRVWTRTAAPGDAGSRVTVTTSTQQKSDLTVVAYRSSAGAASVSASAAVIQQGTPATRLTPTGTGGGLAAAGSPTASRAFTVCIVLKPG